MKKILFVLVAFLFVTSASAVLKEENLNRTVKMLRIELENFQRNQARDFSKFDTQRKNYWRELNDNMEKTEELSLVLYSQKDNFMFGLAHGCRQVRDMYRKFDGDKYPFTEWKNNYESEILRYTKLSETLSRITPSLLSAEGKTDLKKAIEICDSVKRSLAQKKQMLKSDDSHYEKIAKKMLALEQYTERKYASVRHIIFIRGSESYFSLLDNFSERWTDFKNVIYDTYFTGQNASSEWKQRSWELIIGSLITLLLAIGISYLLFFRLIPKYSKQSFLVEKKIYWAICLTLLLTSAFLFIMSITVLQRNYFIIAATMMIEYLWLLIAILFSITIRVKKENIHDTIILYSPAMWIGLLLITMRILMISNEIVRMIWPPFLLVSLMIHLALLIRYSRQASRTDSFYGWLLFVILSACTIIAWSGHTFMSLQIVMLWLILLTGFQGLISMHRLLVPAGAKKTAVTQHKYYYSMIEKLVFPLLTIFVIVFSFIWAAHIFDLGGWLLEQFKKHFIAIPNIATLSIEKILWVIGIGVVVNYCVFITKEILRSIYGDSKCETGVIPVATTIGTMCVWAVYAVTIIFIFDINSTGLVAILGGLSMGVGLALKDTIDNLFCGLSLMLGRVRMGDMIECDGIRGRITNISIRSTMLETIDGSVIAFLNNQLFTKNFKNLTRNHNFEKERIAIGVAYGTDVEKAKNIVLECANRQPDVKLKNDPIVLMTNFGDSSIDLLLIVWLPINKKGLIMSTIREDIYNEFNKQGVEIPFPQRDIHIRDIANLPEKS